MAGSGDIERWSENTRGGHLRIWNDHLRGAYAAISPVFHAADHAIQVLSGERPFSEYGASQIITAVIIRDERPPKLPLHSASGTPYNWLWALAETCWATDPNDRPTALEMIRSFPENKTVRSIVPRRTKLLLICGS